MKDPEPGAMPAPGDLAPDFEGPTQAGETLLLSSLRGRPVALVFYPKDDTPGCTRQACSLRDATDDLREAGVTVVGVSPDDARAHARFAKRYALPYPLVSDPERRILAAYGVWGEKTLFGRLFMGVRRTTFLIDAGGYVVDVIRRPDVERHAEEVLERFRTAGLGR